MPDGSSSSSREESKLPWGRLEESKLSARDDDDDLYYETASQKSKTEEEDADYPSEDDSFVKYINEVLGPIHPYERNTDPLSGYTTNDDFTRWQ